MWTVVDSPVGALRLVSDGSALTGVEFGPHRGDLPLDERDDADSVLAETFRQLAAYFAGDLTEFDLPLAPAGSEFQLRVWQALRAIPYGATATYGQIAQRIGHTPAASRAVGLANGANPIPVVIPCHRVIGADGSMTGFGGGIERKQILLGIELDVLF